MTPSDTKSDAPTAVPVDPKKLKALDAAMAKIGKEHGDEAIRKMSGPPKKIASIPSRCLPLDIALGIGGIPRGRIIEIYGPESSGKTTLVYHWLASVQAMGGIAAFIDTEHAMDPIYARAVGVDTDELLISQPDYGEQALQIADVLVNSGAVDIVAIDSVAALTPKAELEGQIGDTTVGLQARMMSQAMRKLAGAANKSDTTLVFTNQLREKVGVSFGSPETQPGGRALKFYASQRLDIRRIETVKDGTDAVANRVRVKVVKNKVAPPFKQAEFEIVYGEGADRYGALLDFCLEPKNPDELTDLITKSGAFFKWNPTGETMGQGRAKAKAWLAEHPEESALIEETAKRIFLTVSSDEPSVGEDAAEADVAPEPELAVA